IKMDADLNRGAEYLARQQNTVSCTEKHGLGNQGTGTKGDPFVSIRASDDYLANVLEPVSCDHAADYRSGASGTDGVRHEVARRGTAAGEKRESRGNRYGGRSHY